VRRAFRPHSRQHGSAMIEFAWAGPLLTLLGLGLLQYAMLFFARNSFDYAAFMAARAGAVGNASLASVQDAYLRALVPAYGGGRNAEELAESYAKAAADLQGHLRIEMLNPTKESFDDWNDPALQQSVGQGRRVIPNGKLAQKNPAEVKSRSGQNIQDANLIKLRITQGYQPKVPLMATLYTKYLREMDSGTDGFESMLINAGRIPMVTHITMQMQSDAIESEQVVSMASGNGPSPSPAPAAGDAPPPNCASGACSGSGTSAPPPGDSAGATAPGADVPVCTASGSAG